MITRSTKDSRAEVRSTRVPRLESDHGPQQMGSQTSNMEEHSAWLNSAGGSSPITAPNTTQVPRWKPDDSTYQDAGSKAQARSQQLYNNNQAGSCIQITAPTAPIGLWGSKVQAFHGGILNTQPKGGT